MITPVEQQHLYDYWISKKEGNRLPSRQHLEPTEIPRLLSVIGLLDVLDCDDFRYRLIGTSMVAFFGQDFTNTLVSVSKVGNYGNVLSDLYSVTRDEKVPVYSVSQFLFESRAPVQMYRLILPLSSDGNNVDMLLFSTIPDIPAHLSNTSFEVIGTSHDFIESARVLDKRNHEVNFS